MARRLYSQSAGDPESGFYHEAADGFLAKDQTMNFLELFLCKRRSKIGVAFPKRTLQLCYYNVSAHNVYYVK
jgi:hypothetical protein